MNPAVYSRPAKPLRVPVKRRDDFDKVAIVAAPEIVAVDKFTECHVTPPDVAARMVDYLGGAGEGATLEPSAGTGNISRALVAAGHARDLVQVERHIRLSAGLTEFGAVINRCFLEYAAEIRGRTEFARIVMNPPFSDVRRHVAAARGLLGRGGVLVALVPVTYQGEGMETLEQLGADTFATAKVYTKIVRFRGAAS